MSIKYYVPQLLKQTYFKEVSVKEIKKKQFPVIIRSKSMDEICCSSENYSCDFDEEELFKDSIELFNNDLITICTEYENSINIFFPLVTDDELCLWIFNGKLFYPNFRIPTYWEVVVSDFAKIKKNNIIFVKNFGVEILFKPGKIWMAPQNIKDYKIYKEY